MTRAVQAGMDVLLFSNTAKYRASLGARRSAISSWPKAEADPAFAARIEESYERIVALKARGFARERGLTLSASSAHSSLAVTSAD